jgi:hypothetical protein
MQFVKFARNRNKEGKIAYSAQAYSHDIYTPSQTVTFNVTFDNLNDASEWFNEQQKASGFELNNAPEKIMGRVVSVSLFEWLKKRYT